MRAKRIERERDQNFELMNLSLFKERERERERERIYDSCFFQKIEIAKELLN
jgi:hypothetical protein